MAWLLGAGYPVATFVADEYREQSSSKTVWPDPAGFVATAAYAAVAAVAAVDAARRLSSEESDGDAQLDASIMVCCYAFLACCVALVMRDGRGAIAVWAPLACLALAPILVYHSIPGMSPALFLPTTVVKLGAFIYIHAPFFFTDDRWRLTVLSKSGIIAIAGVPLISLVVRLVKAGPRPDEGFCMGTDGASLRPRFVFLWPRTAAGWLDLDQAAALGAALVVTAVGLLNRNEWIKMT